MALNLNLPSKRKRRVVKRTEEDFGINLKSSDNKGENLSDPDTDTDSAPDTDTDSAPDTDTDSAPDTDTDSAPDTDTDSAPDKDTDSAPDTDTDSAPDTKRRFNRPIRTFLKENELIRKRVLRIAKKPSFPNSARKNKYEALKSKEESLAYLVELFGSKKRIVVEFFKVLKTDKMTPRMSIDEAASLCDLKKSTFERTVDRLVSEAVLHKYGFKTRTGGAVYWFHPTILGGLNLMHTDDPMFFDYE